VNKIRITYIPPVHDSIQLFNRTFWVADPFDYNKIYITRIIVNNTTKLFSVYPQTFSDPKDSCISSGAEGSCCAGQNTCPRSPVPSLNLLDEPVCWFIWQGRALRSGQQSVEIGTQRIICWYIWMWGRIYLRAFIKRVSH